MPKVRMDARSICLRFVVCTCAFALVAQTVQAQIVIPGSGQRMMSVGDDFEDEDWEFIQNWPKSSREFDKQVRYPTGYAKNQRWFESPKRGMPDILKRVETPPGGLPGSKGSLRMQTLYTNIPNKAGTKGDQDDLIVSGQYVSISQSPNVIVRVFLPPFEEWDNHTGSSFGFRMSLTTTINKSRFGLFSRKKDKKKKYNKREAYWPGIFIQFNSETDPKYKEDYAVFVIRSDERGRDFVGPTITQTGWWTLGLSATPDGRVHYFVSPGVDPLTMKDYVASTYPYGYRAENFNTFFFNVANRDDGKNWSTEWIVDDPALYVGGSRYATGNRFIRR